MNAVVFDTLKFAKRLEQAGIPVEHAEAISEAFRDATGEELVTRDYLDARLSAQTSEHIKWMAGLLLAQGGLVVALVKLLG